METDSTTAAAPTPEEFPLTLEEFCLRLSHEDRRVEAIGAFNHVETVAGRTVGLASEFRARYAAFLKQPA